jgi:hypothetical protein
LWQLWWVIDLPIDYSANEASNSNVITAAKGFELLVTPMFVNCPNIGLVDTSDDVNEDKKNSFTTTISLSEESAWILGTDGTLIFQNSMPITFFLPDGTLIGNTTTNFMGAYEYELKTADIPAGTEIIKVMFKDALIRNITVVTSGAASVASFGAVMGAALFGLFVALW